MQKLALVFGQALDPLSSACILGLGIACSVPHVSGVTFGKASSANPGGLIRDTILEFVLLHMQQVVLRIIGGNSLHLLGAHHGSIGESRAALGWTIFERFVVNGLQVFFPPELSFGISSDRDVAFAERAPPIVTSFIRCLGMVALALLRAAKCRWFIKNWGMVFAFVMDADCLQGELGRVIWASCLGIGGFTKVRLLELLGMELIFWRFLMARMLSFEMSVFGNRDSSSSCTFNLVIAKSASPSVIFWAVFFGCCGQAGVSLFPIKPLRFVVQIDLIPR